MHRLYVSGPGGRVDRDTRRTIETLAGEAFDGYTLMRATGAWKGERMRCVAIDIAHRDTGHVRAFAARLATALSQTSIGMVVDGRYFEIRAQ